MYNFWEKKKYLPWKISTKFTTFEESTGSNNAVSERKGPDLKLGVR